MGRVKREGEPGGEKKEKSKMGEEGGQECRNAERKQTIDDVWCHQVGGCVCV